jgi:hypothetical protein
VPLRDKIKKKNPLTTKDHEGKHKGTQREESK